MAEELIAEAEETGPKWVTGKLPPRKELYIALTDKTSPVRDRILKNGFKQFEEKLLSDKDTQTKLGNYLISSGKVKDADEFYSTFLQVDTQPLIIKPQPSTAIPPTLAAPPSLTDRTMEQALTPMQPDFQPNFQQWQNQAEIDQSAKSPVFRENKLALSAQKDGIIMPTKEAEESFNQMSPEAQQAAIEGGSGNQLAKDEAAKRKTFGERVSNLGSQVSALGSNIKKKMDAGIGNLAGFIPTSINFMIPGTKEYDEGFLYRQQSKEGMYNSAKEADAELEKAALENNVETSMIEAIKRGEYGRVPEAVAYNVAQGGLQILPAIFTEGYSMFLQTLPDAYKSGVDRIAQEKGLTPEQVIQGNLDAPIVANLSAGVQAALESAGANLVSKSIASKGAYAAVKDWLVSKTGSKALGRVGAMGFTGGGEALTEAMQADVARTMDELSASKNKKDFIEKLTVMYNDPEYWDEIIKNAEGGFIGGGGVTVGGKLAGKAGSGIVSKFMAKQAVPPSNLGGIPTVEADPNDPNFVPEVPVEEVVQEEETIPVAEETIPTNETEPTPTPETPIEPIPSPAAGNQVVAEEGVEDVSVEPTTTETATEEVQLRDEDNGPLRPEEITDSGFFGVGTDGGYYDSNDKIQSKYQTTDIEWKDLEALPSHKGYYVRVRPKGDKQLVSLYFKVYNTNTTREGGQAAINFEIPENVEITQQLIDRFIPVADKFKEDNYSIQGGFLRPNHKYENIVEPDFSLLLPANAPTSPPTASANLDGGFPPQVGTENVADGTQVVPVASETGPVVASETTPEGPANAVPLPQVGQVESVESKTPPKEMAEGFTEGPHLNKITKEITAKLGNKAKKYFEQVNRLFNPNKVKIIEYRTNGVITEENGRPVFNGLGDTDLKNWRVSWRFYDDEKGAKKGIVKENPVPLTNEVAKEGKGRKTIPELQKQFEAIKKKHSKYLKKDGGLKSDKTPKEVIDELVSGQKDLRDAIKREREQRVAEDKRDTGLSDGINRIKSDKTAFEFVRRVMRLGLIPDKLFNEFGKNLLHIKTEGLDSDELLMQTMEIIQDFEKRENVKPDDAVAREIQRIENLRFSELESENESSESTTQSTQPISESPFPALDAALELKGPKATEAREALKEKFGKDKYKKMVEITKNFEKIIDGLQESGRLVKDCP